jgi:hypothetical protein
MDDPSPKRVDIEARKFKPEIIGMKKRGTVHRNLSIPVENSWKIFFNFYTRFIWSHYYQCLMAS